MGENWPADEPERNSAPDSLPATIDTYSCLQPHKKICNRTHVPVTRPSDSRSPCPFAGGFSRGKGRGKFSSSRSREFGRDREPMPAPEDKSIPLLIRSLLQRLLLHPGQGPWQSLDSEHKEWMRILRQNQSLLLGLFPALRTDQDALKRYTAACHSRSSVRLMHLKFWTGTRPD